MYTDSQLEALRIAFFGLIALALLSLLASRGIPDEVPLAQAEGRGRADADRLTRAARRVDYRGTVTTDAVPAAPPVAARTPIVRSHHGDDVEDPYEWFRAKEDAAVVAHLEAENAYTEARTAHLEGLRGRIFDEIKGRTLETDLSVPSRHGVAGGTTAAPMEGKQYGIQCRAPLASPDDWTPPELSPDVAVPGEQILLDGNVEAEGHEFFSLGSFEVSNDGTLMLYGVDVAGDERYTVRVRNLVTGEQLPDEIPGTFAGATFSPDGRFIVYTTVDDAWRPDTVWLHELGTPVADDVKLFHEPDERYWVGAGLHPQRPLPRDRDRLLDHERGMARGCRRPAFGAACGVAAHRGRRVRLHRTPSSTARTCSSSSTTTEPWTSSWCGWRHPTPQERGRP